VEYVIATNDSELRQWLNYDRLASSPGLKIDGRDDIRSCDRDNNDSECADHDDTQPEVILTNKMTSAGSSIKVDI
jgi:hypothetical protein